MNKIAQFARERLTLIASISLLPHVAGGVWVSVDSFVVRVGQVASRLGLIFDCFVPSRFALQDPLRTANSGFEETSQPASVVRSE